MSQQSTNDQASCVVISSLWAKREQYHDNPHSCDDRLMTHLSGLLDVEPLGQQVGHFDEAHQVVHITLDASGYSRVLDLHGKAPAIMQVSPMHLHPTPILIPILIPILTLLLIKVLLNKTSASQR